MPRAGWHHAVTPPTLPTNRPTRPPSRPTHLQRLGHRHLRADAQRQLRNHAQATDRHAQGVEQVGVGGGGDGQGGSGGGDERQGSDLQERGSVGKVCKLFTRVEVWSGRKIEMLAAPFPPIPPNHRSYPQCIPPVS